MARIDFGGTQEDVITVDEFSIDKAREILKDETIAVIGYGVQYGGSVIHEGTAREGMEQPAHYWVPSIATSGLMVYTGDKFPAWRGNIFVGGLAGQQLARLTLDGQRVLSEETLLPGMGRIRDIRQGPDGFIYIAIEDRRGGRTPIIRLEPASES